MAKVMEKANEFLPYFKTEIPGPIGKEIIARDNKVMSTSYTRPYPFVMDHGEGAMVYDTDGNRFLDVAAGIAVCSTGHSHPEVVKAIQEQSEKFLHMSSTDFYSIEQVQLAEKLAEKVPVKGLKKRVLFTNSGTESVEGAIKLSRYATRRKHLIAFYGSFHGRTLGSLSLTASKVVQRESFGPFLPEVTHLPYADCYHCPETFSTSMCRTCGLGELTDNIIKHTVSPKEIAAVFVEPIQGEGGYIVPPREFLTRLRSFCDQYGILLVADEVQTGMGRTGKMFALEHFGIQADIICLAKGIASGLPLGAIVAGDNVMNWPPGSHASTFGGNPVACAASLKTIELLDKEIIKNAEIQGKHLKHRLVELLNKYESVGDVRGLGLMVGMEFVKDKKSKLPDAQLRDKVIDQAFEKGILLLGCGNSTLRFCPPLVIQKPQIDFLVDTLDNILDDLTN